MGFFFYYSNFIYAGKVVGLSQFTNSFPAIGVVIINGYKMDQGKSLISNIKVLGISRSKIYIYKLQIDSLSLHSKHRILLKFSVLDVDRRADMLPKSVFLFIFQPYL